MEDLFFILTCVTTLINIQIIYSDVTPSLNLNAGQVCNITIEEAIERYLPRCASCNGRCGTTSNIYMDMGCSCDTSCVFYRDCCPDFTKFCPLEVYKGSLIVPEHTPSCTPVVGHFGSPESYLLVDTCLNNNDACNISKHSPNQYIPVFDPKTGVHFVNFNCAVCNGAMTVKPWDTYLRCDSLYVTQRSNMSETLTKEEFNRLWQICDIGMDPYKNLPKPRQCVPNYKRNNIQCHHFCKQTKFENLCRTEQLTYLSLLDHNRHYFNFYCMICVDPTLLLTEYPGCHIPFGAPGAGGPKPGSFSFKVLFDAHSKQGFTVGEERPASCPDGQIWFSTEQKCKNLNTRMIKDDENKDNHTLITVTLVIKIVDGINVTSQHISELYVALGKNIVYEDLIILRFNDFTVAIQYSFRNGTLVSKDLILNITKSLFDGQEVILLYNENDRNKLECKETPVVYLWNEYELLTDRRIILKQSNITMSTPDFQITTNFSLIVCPTPETLGPLNPMDIVTIVCTSLSILALIIRLILHCLLRDKGPARLQVCLALSLLLAMVSFLLNPLMPLPSNVCYAVGVLIHYFFMAAFCWMTVIGFDILLMFKASTSLQRMKAGNKRFLFYSLYGWGFPMLMLIISLTMDHSTVTPLWRPSYGARMCWISSGKGLYVYFITPVALQVVLNITLFAVCVLYLHKNKLTRNSGTKKEEKSRFGLHVQLLIVMGITWAIGFVAIPLNNDAIWYVFIVLNASQGIFLLFVYLIGRNTRQKLKGNIHTFTQNIMPSKTRSSSLEASQT